MTCRVLSSKEKNYWSKIYILKYLFVNFIDFVYYLRKFIGFKETSKGCVGSGTMEAGEAAKGMKTCKDPAKYVFWDAVHPTERMYKIIADEAMRDIVVKL